jgi:hypothetical protein
MKLPSAIPTLALMACLTMAPSVVTSFAPPLSSTGTKGPRRVQPIMNEKSSSENPTFSLGNLFSGKPTAEGGATTTSLRGNKGLEAHPSVRPHVSPLNRLLENNGREEKPMTSEALPVHPEVRSGVLPNGLPYIILPNKSPPGRFEAHLQVFSGSADELEPQQGIAHLTEHVAYMGSRKRERLFGTGSQTNAYTDFHHTVFYAACPVQTPRGGAPMLPMALDALVDVMEARVETSRLEKERAAVLSEMTMVRLSFLWSSCWGAFGAENGRFTHSLASFLSFDRSTQSNIVSNVRFCPHFIAKTV